MSQPATPAARELPRSQTSLKPSRMFSALRHPNYRLWFIGQMISLCGTWMQGTAQAFFVYELTHSSAYLGLMGFAAGVPSWLLMLYGGVVADRMPRRTLLIAAQFGMMAQALLLTVLAFLHLVQPWHLIALSVFLGVANAFDAPARMAFVSEIVPREDMTNAIALNSIMFNSSMAVGPALAGILYALFGPGWCFAVNTASFLAIIVGLVLMKLPRMKPAPRGRSTMADIKEGIRYVAGHRLIASIILLVGLTTFFGVGFVTLFPAWAVKILGGDATTNGFLQSARGLGALGGGFLIAALGRPRSRGRLLTAGTFLFPAAVLIFAFLRKLPATLAVLFAAGAALILVFNLCNSLVQTHVEDRVRGRVMGLYSLTFFGTLPLASLWVGALAHRVGEPTTVIVGGVCLLVSSAGLWFAVPQLRRAQ